MLSVSLSTDFNAGPLLVEDVTERPTAGESLHSVGERLVITLVCLDGRTRHLGDSLNMDPLLTTVMFDVTERRVRGGALGIVEIPIDELAEFNFR